jgi:hypothetical protein
MFWKKMCVVLCENARWKWCIDAHKHEQWDSVENVQIWYNWYNPLLAHIYLYIHMYICITVLQVIERFRCGSHGILGAWPGMAMPASQVRIDWEGLPPQMAPRIWVKWFAGKESPKMPQGKWSYIKVLLSKVGRVLIRGVHQKNHCILVHQLLLFSASKEPLHSCRMWLDHVESLSTACPRNHGYKQFLAKTPELQSWCPSVWPMTHCRDSEASPRSARSPRGSMVPRPCCHAWYVLLTDDTAHGWKCVPMCPLQCSKSYKQHLIVCHSVWYGCRLSNLLALLMFDEEQEEQCNKQGLGNHPSFFCWPSFLLGQEINGCIPL